MFELTIKQTVEKQDGERETIEICKHVSFAPRIDVLGVADKFLEEPRAPRSDKGTKRKTDQPQLPNT